jgi:Uma2 family endonuclease
VSMSLDTSIVTKKLFTVEEFQRICDIDIFPPDSRYELIGGEIIEMPTPSHRHSGRINKLTRVFTSRLGETVIVSIQNGMYANEYSEPKPDVAVCKPLPELFGPFEPSPEDVLLLVEISDTSLRYDTRIKAPLYAQCGIPEYWILNIADGVLEVRTNASGGEYQNLSILERGQTITPQMLPGTIFTVDELID